MNVDADNDPELQGTVYEQLRRIAASYLAREPAAHTLQPTALVHEAWMKLAGQSAGQNSNVQDEAHFRALASIAMRRILVDHARAKAAGKRSAEGERMTLSGVADGDVPGPDDGEEFELLALDAALTKLSAVNARQGSVVEHRFFGGLSVEETAEVLGVSRRTVIGDWRLARAWILREIANGDAGEGDSRDVE